ncbi:MAG: XkdW family protein, partial [Chloroflexota bacterium]|nr:XkdW family protein [Chloroflexota bacterium]
MNIASGLIHLGFDAEKDFNCQDDADGKGPYIAAWYSDKPQPSEKQIAIAIKAYEAEWNAQEYARQREAEYPTWNEVNEAMAEKLEGRGEKWEAVSQK